MSRSTVRLLALSLLLAGCSSPADTEGCPHVDPAYREGPAVAVAMDRGTYETVRYKSMSFYLPDAARGTHLTSSDPQVVRISKQPPQHVPGEYQKWLKFGWTLHAGSAVLRMTSDDNGRVYRLRVNVSC